MIKDYIKRYGMPLEAIWINPDTLEQVYCKVVGVITEGTSLVDFGNLQREVYNDDLRFE